MKLIVMALTSVLVFSVPFTTVAAVEKVAMPAAGLQTVTLDVQKMDCPMCKITIRKALEKVPGVTSASVDYEAKTATVTFDPKQGNLEALTAATTNAGYPSTVKAN
jgi:periplasmic mercuric ion binding protein